MGSVVEIPFSSSSKSSNAAPAAQDGARRALVLMAGKARCCVVNMKLVRI
jgi:hypothetical protein